MREMGIADKDIIDILENKDFSVAERIVKEKLDKKMEDMAWDYYNTYLADELDKMMSISKKNV